MSGSWDNSGQQYIALSAGACGPVGTGAHTIAMLIQRGGATSNDQLIACYAGATLVRQMLIDSSGPVFAQGDFGNGSSTSITAGVWYVVVASKIAGTAAYRYAVWLYASDGSGTMVHNSSSDATHPTDGAAITQIRIGGGDVNGFGLIAVAALWTSVLTDTQLDTLKSAALADWAALSPQSLISLENWDGSTGCTDVVGTAAQTGITGAVQAGANPTGFDFTLSGGATDAPWPSAAAGTAVTAEAGSWSAGSTLAAAWPSASAAMTGAASPGQWSSSSAITGPAPAAVSVAATAGTWTATSSSGTNWGSAAAAAAVAASPGSWQALGATRDVLVTFGPVVGGWYAQLAGSNWIPETPIGGWTTEPPAGDWILEQPTS